MSNVKPNPADVTKIVDLYHTLPRRTLADGDRSYALWVDSPAIAAKIAVIMLKSPSVTTPAWCRAADLAGVRINPSTLANLRKGRSPSYAPWKELRELLTAARVQWVDRDQRTPIAPRTEQPVVASKAEAPTQADPKMVVQTGDGVKWRQVDGGDIEVTTLRLLPVGSPEYTEFVRRVLPECGTVRA